MKRLFFTLLALLLIPTAAVRAYAAEERKNADFDLKAKSAYLVNYETGAAIYAHNENQRLPIASMCKIMSLLLIYESMDRGELDYGGEITVSEEAAGMGGSQVFLDANRVYKISELMNGIEDSVKYTITKSSLSNSSTEEKTVKYSVNMSERPYPLAMIGDKIGIIVRVRGGGSSQEIEGFNDITGRKQHGIANGDLFIRIIMDMEGLEITETSDLLQTVDLPLSEILFAEETVLTNPFGKKYKIKSINSPALSNVQVRIPEQGLVSASGRRGSYIFRLNITRPDLSKLSDEKLALLKELLRDLDK